MKWVPGDHKSKQEQIVNSKPNLFWMIGADWSVSTQNGEELIFEKS